MELITGENDKNRRLDRILRKALPGCPLPLIHRLIRQKQVLINGKPGKAQDRLNCGDKILIPSLNDIHKNINSQYGKKKYNDVLNPGSRKRKNLKTLSVIWEGRGLLAVNKPAGLSVHGKNSLDTMVLSYLADKLPPSLSFKPGPLHRLDKPSSGIVVFSSSLEGGRLFSSLLHERKIKKTYLVITEGIIEKDKLWQDDLFRDKEKKKTFINVKSDNHMIKNAITKITPLAVSKAYSLIKAEIETGRTHQIRAQAAFHGHPLAGDVKYGGRRIIRNFELEIRSEKRERDKEQIAKNRESSEKKAVFFLHAWKLEFLEYSLEAPLPQEFCDIIEVLFNFPYPFENPSSL